MTIPPRFAVTAMGLFMLVLAPFLGAQAASAQDVSKFNQFDSDSQITVDHSVWSALLSKYLVEKAVGANLVDYGAVTEADRAALQAYLDDLQAVDPSTLNRDEAFAYWVNLYNARTVELILEEYPVKSIRNIGGLFSFGPWGQQIITVSGEDLSLDNVEHDILRAFWDEPRIHYAVNCASLGCPDLRATAWTAEGLDAALDEAARAYVNDPRGARVERGRLIVSKIYDWFKEDFGGNEAGIVRHIRQYADADLAAQLDGRDDVNRYEYDWDLNGTE